MVQHEFDPHLTSPLQGEGHKKNILVIKHGALGDIVLATASFAAIRAHHKHAHITLLTTRPYASFLASSSYFDEVWIDARPKMWRLFTFFTLIKKLRSRKFARVYDLQTSTRSSAYLKFFPAGVEWSGIAASASHRHNTPERTTLHTIDREKQQLEIAGIHHDFLPSLDWLTGDISSFREAISGVSSPWKGEDRWGSTSMHSDPHPDLPPARGKEYALFIPGGSAHRPEKRWPVEYFQALAQWAAEQSITPVLIGTGAEADLLESIEKNVPGSINLCNRTSFGQIAELARQSRLAVGNDTGPMHIAAATGIPSVVLFSSASDPALCAPRTDKTQILQKENLRDLFPETVIKAIRTCS